MPAGASAAHTPAGARTVSSATLPRTAMTDSGPVPATVPRASRQGPRMLRLPGWRGLADIGVFNLGCWVVSSALFELFKLYGIDARQSRLADWGVGFLGELGFRLALYYGVSLLPTTLRVLRVAGILALQWFAALLGVVAIIELLAALRLLPWPAIGAYLLWTLAGMGVLFAAAGAVAFMIRDVEWATGEVHLAPWRVPVSGRWDTSALDEDDSDSYEWLRDGGPYDEVAVLLARLGDSFPRHED